MRRRVIPSPDAEEDIRSAIRWYQNQDVDLPLRFNAERRAALARIASNPYQFPIINNLTRRALMKRFPYAIYFIAQPEVVSITSVLHQRRFNPWHRP